jgi:two-component system, LytTR family, sensor kinase
MPYQNSKIERSIQYPGLASLSVAWILLGSLACIRHILLDHVPYHRVPRELADWLTCYVPWVLLSPLVSRLERMFPLNRSQWRKHSFILLAPGLALSYVAAIMAVVIFLIEQRALGVQGRTTVPWWKLPNSEFLFQTALFCVALLAACMIRNLIEMQESERRAAQLLLEKSEVEASLRKSELEMLRLRLNPHFLFNSLQNISTLARQDPDAASRMLARLGDLLRAALRKGTPEQTTLASEVALTKAYIEVEQIRFGGGLSVLFEIDREMENALVPGFILQPLVENAITHGLRGGQRSGAIWVRAAREAQNLVLTVSDNGSGPPAERLADLEMGIGLGSTCDRLNRMFPGRHSVSMKRLDEGGTEVRIELPLQWAEFPVSSEQHEHAQSAHR